MKRQPTEQEKMSASHISDKGLISKIYKLIQLNSKKTWTLQFLKWAKYLNRHFSKEGIQMENRYMKRYSTSLSGKCKSKSQWAMTLHLLEWLLPKRRDNKYWQWCGEKGTLVRIYDGMLFSHEKKEILPFVTIWMNLKGIMLSEISQSDRCFMTSLICGN